jgi:hypothetical protein
MLISIVADPAVGGTFLTWSLHYLVGHKTYYSISEEKYINLVDNPITDINAHRYIANQPHTLSQFNECIRLVKSTPAHTDSFHTIYFHNFLTIPVTTTSACVDTTAAVDQLYSITDKIIMLYNHSSHALYHAKFQGRDLTPKFNNSRVRNQSFEEQHQDFIDTFFIDSKLKWEQLGLTDTWDHREFLALNLRPFDTITIVPNVDQTKEHYPLDCFELFNNFDKTVVSLFDFLELKIDADRWEPWLTVYNQWRELHTDRILFVEYFDQIIDSIINNYYMELSRFKLDIVREAVIQHVLLYKHGLNFKTWVLEKFPDNTQDLHTLLEPNIYHDVKDIYGELN